MIAFSQVAIAQEDPLDSCKVDVLPISDEELRDNMASVLPCAMLGPGPITTCCPWKVVGFSIGFGEVQTITNTGAMTVKRTDTWANNYTGPTLRCGQGSIPSIPVTESYTTVLTQSGEASFSGTWSFEGAAELVVTALMRAIVAAGLSAGQGIQLIGGAKYGWSNTQTPTSTIGTPNHSLLIPCGFRLIWEMKAGPLTVTETQDIYFDVQYSATCGSTSFNDSKKCLSGTITATVINNAGSTADEFTWINLRDLNNPCHEYCP